MLMFAQSVLTGQCVRCTLYTLHTVYILSMQVVSIHLKEPGSTHSFTAPRNGSIVIGNEVV